MATPNAVQTTSAPFTSWGFRELGWIEGASPTGGFETYAINSTDANLYFTGDVVQRSSLVSGIGAYQPYITIPSSALGSLITPLGIFVGCEYYNPNVARKVWASWWPGGPQGGVDGTAYVVTDPNRRWFAQVSSNAGALGSSVIGQGIGLSTTSAIIGSSQGNQLSGQSVMALNSTSITPASSVASMFRILDFWANWVGGYGPGTTLPSAANFFFNGTDPTSAGPALVVQFNAFERNVTTTNV